jgi:hypothetical protein
MISPAAVSHDQPGGGKGPEVLHLADQARQGLAPGFAGAFAGRERLSRVEHREIAAFETGGAEKILDGRLEGVAVGEPPDHLRRHGLAVFLQIDRRLVRH